MPATLAVLILANPGFETGDLTGWTASDPSVVVLAHTAASPPIAGSNSPHAGGWFVDAGTEALTSLWQAFDVSAHAADIDAGAVTLTGLGAWHATYAIQTDHGHLFATFLDGDGEEISTAAGADAHPSVWTLETLADAPVPAGTRSVRIGVVNVRDEGLQNNNDWDDFVSPSLVSSAGDGPAHQGAIAFRGTLGLALGAAADRTASAAFRGALRLKLAGEKSPLFVCETAPAKGWAFQAAPARAWARLAAPPPEPCDGDVAAAAAAAGDLALISGERLVGRTALALKLIG